MATGLREESGISAGRLFSSVRIVPLRAAPRSLVHSVARVGFFRNQCCVRSCQESRVFIFSQRKHFRFTLGRGKSNPKRCLGLSSFTVSATHEGLMMLYTIDGTLFFCSLKNGFVRGGELPSVTKTCDSLRFRGGSAVTFFACSCSGHLGFCSLSGSGVVSRCFRRRGGSVFYGSMFPFPRSLYESLAGAVCSLSGAALARLCR